MFVSLEPVAVADEAGNTIYIRAKMDVATKNRVVGDTAQMGASGEAEIDIGRYQTALLIHNIVRWEGPDFNGTTCTPEHIGQLDPDEPLVTRVLEEIATRNAPPKKTPPAAGSEG